MSILDLEIASQEAPVTKSWSKEQKEIFDYVEALPETNLMVQAVAGSGKTTTILEALNHAPGSSILLAFNKAIAEDMRRKAQSGEVKTLNALGHKLMMENNPWGDLKASKVRDIVKTLLSPEDLKEHGYAVQRTVGLAKNNAIGIGNDPEASEFADLMEAYDLNVPTDRLADLSLVAMSAFRASIDNISTFDFDDQLYIPLHRCWTFPSYSNAFVDEAQDLSGIQHRMVEALQGQGSRVVAVGDRHQAIYGFRGVLSNSMDLLKEEFRMEELPLSTTYRCPQSVVAEAQAICPQIQYREGAPEGQVDWADLERGDPQLFAQSLVVCRNNAPLFKVIMRHVRAKSPCRVLSNFLESFKGFIRGFKCESSADFMTKLNLWYEKEALNAKSKMQWGKLEGITDKYETAKLLAGEYKTTREMVQLLERLAMGSSGPVFSTIHKAKGLEHENVYILRPDLIPAKYAYSEEAKQQEMNLLYVAITRSAMNLRFGESR